MAGGTVFVGLAVGTRFPLAESLNMAVSADLLRCGDRHLLGCVLRPVRGMACFTSDARQSIMTGGSIIACRVATQAIPRLLLSLKVQLKKRIDPGIGVCRLSPRLILDGVALGTALCAVVAILRDAAAFGYHAFC